MRIYTATHLLPVSSPPVVDGAIAVREGRIIRVGPREELLAAADDGAEVRHLGRVVVLPGLVNAHCHVEFSRMGQDPPPGGDYLVWLRGLLARRAVEDVLSSREAATRAIEFMVARGTVAVGDISNQGWVVPLLARSTLSGIAFHEIYGPRSGDAERLVEEAVERLDTIASDPDLKTAGDRWRVILTPHAPHTTSERLLRALAGRAAASGEPLSIHLAESEAEGLLLRAGEGPFRELFRERGLWDEDWTAPRLTPVEYVDRLGGLTARTLAVHCVKLQQRDVSKLQTRGVTVITCPRSNRRLGVGRAPVPQLLGQGIPVALGTDSLASAPDLDLFAEMAALGEEHPELGQATMLRMATLNGAVALGLAERFGSIEPGKLARLVVVPLAASEDALSAVCSGPERVFALDDAPYEESRA